MKKNIIVVFSAFIAIILVLVMIVYNNSYKNDVYVENKTNNKNQVPGLISLMLETKAGSGIYNASPDGIVPTKGYELNTEKSGCENGGTITYNETTKKFILKSNISTKCYAYFDVIPPDVTLSITNRPTTYGKLGSINCTNSNASYNQKYNRVEISSIDKKFTSCTLNYTDSTSKVNLADYIIGLSGTTQGTGEVVNETLTTIDNSTFTDGVKLEQSGYTVSSNDATYPFEWDNTNKTWTSTNHTNSATATFIFNVATSGNYQVCYKQSSEKNYDYAIFYKDNTQIKSLKGISNNNFECYYLGSLATSNTIKVTYRKNGSGSSGSDNVIFYLQSGTYNENIQTVSAGIRYEGKNPNNYVWFNNEYWRIIGVFDSASHGQSNKNLVKIIRADGLDGLAWHKSNSNDWKAASLNKLLNGAYYNAQDGTSSGYCCGYGSVTANCDYTKKGIQAGYRKMIANVIWYLGIYSSYSSSSSDTTAKAFYGYERRPKSTTGYIGLMYPSDYGYSVLSSSCARTTNLSSYATAKCAGQSWLYGKGIEWTLMTDNQNNSFVFSLSHNGNVGSSNNNALSGFGSRPVLYLDASVYKIDGDGSLNNPYIVGM